MSVNKARHVERVAITTTSEAGEQVNINALHLRADVFARILTGRETITQNIVDCKNRDGFAVIGGALKSGARLRSYLCQALELVSYCKSTARRKTTFEPIDINIYKFVGVIIFAEKHARGRCLASCANFCKLCQRVNAGGGVHSIVKNTFSGGAHLFIYFYIFFHTIYIYVIKKYLCLASMRGRRKKERKKRN